MYVPYELTENKGNILIALGFTTLLLGGYLSLSLRKKGK